MVHAPKYEVKRPGRKCKTSKVKVRYDTDGGPIPFCEYLQARRIAGPMTPAVKTTTFAEQRAFAAQVAKEKAATAWAVEQVRLS